MSAIAWLWELSEQIDRAERELIHARVSLMQLGRAIAPHHAVVCTSCGKVQDAPIPGDAICDCGVPLELPLPILEVGDG